jgi:hypothetical protein
MISAATGPLDATPEGLHALYVSLNSPVISLDALPIGPAQAAIAVHGASGTTLLIRSLRTGTVAFFHADAADARSGAIAALSHAEQLGVLFDEEVGESGLGLDRTAWPRWLVEVFSTGLEEPVDPAETLSKFRWALLGEGSPIGIGERPGAATHTGRF